ncbi:UDP-N-acetylmuramate--L-alanine ligase [Promicromonospora umidemergens]|uniref:UDP-N-acetylmuramate--L-alanine ligase n=1 Tax=Promicromonospora umidemergens TaxID=629679 RepID=A0ABP8XXC0_9MICO|nr:UDP-N-acetylmuramate--L-alanine ligase [Promicromonospora umidemergens]MCP2284241.1 UDP-N-acetylmuramate--L-alanine ligase [Promicromonospora umidemergens]
MSTTVTDQMTGQVARLGRVHMIGIGGAGMSVVARLLAGRGVSVQGSDAAESETLEALRAAGVKVWVGHDPAHLTGVDSVVISSAVHEDNPELAAARARRLNVLHRSQALAALMEGSRGVAVAGAHGKTTTSAMIATILREAGLDPSYAIGSTVRTATGSTPGGHLGASDVLVAEADESDGSFLNYTPTIAVVTNVEADHLDHYGTPEAFNGAFIRFARRLVSDGWLIACADDEGSLSVGATICATGGHVITYGTNDTARVRVTDISTTAEGTTAVLRGDILGTNEQVADGAGVSGTVPGIPMRLSVPGKHNVLNATAAVIVAVKLGVAPEQAVAGVEAFVGTGRRFEEKGTADGVRVIDDYGHHPTEIRAVLTAAREIADGGRVLVLFQPHLYSRTKTFAESFAKELSAADEVVVTDIYGAREERDPSITANTIVDLMTDHGAAYAVPDRLDAAHAIADLARPGDVVLTVGAGDVTQLGPAVLARLTGRVAGLDSTVAPTSGLGED